MNINQVNILVKYKRYTEKKTVERIKSQKEKEWKITNDWNALNPSTEFLGTYLNSNLHF